MKQTTKISLIFAFVLAATSLMAQKNPNFRTRPFDSGWSFKKDDMASGPEKTSFDDSNWRKVDLPHDWSIEDLPNQIADSIVGPFSKASVGKHNTGYVVGGTAWYRNTFKVSKENQGKTVYIQFDGVYMNSDVWINGHHLGNHPYGYTSFYYDLTPFLKPVGTDNVIAVQVKNEGENTRWYSGSGIYRHVYLTIVNPVHVDVWGVSVTTPKVSKNLANVQIVTTVKNAGNANAAITLKTQLIDAKGKVVGNAKSNATVSAGAKTEAKQTIEIVNPKLWSVQSPNLYKAKVTIFVNNKVTDELSTTVGVRDIKIDAEHGLLINGVSVKLKGGCIHHDNGPLGSAAIDRAEERKIELLKAYGFNAVRTSHNPPSQELLDACDRLGLLVMDEAFDTWNKSKNPEDYSLYFKDWWNTDLTSMILRDRNHPSIVLWSIGNEIPERGDELGQETRKMLKQRVSELDPTRKVTEAINLFTSNWEKNTPAIFKTLDIVGYNYLDQKYETDHQSFPELVTVGTESYALKALENWQKIEKFPYVIGDFVWTAMDYLGEAGLTTLPEKRRKWPWINGFCGDIDLIGDKKPQSYYRDIVWRRSNIEIMVKRPFPENKRETVTPWGWPEMNRSWNWSDDEGKKMTVFVYSRCKSVKLELNGKVIGEQKIPENSITATFEVPYEAGTLVARGFDNGKEVASVTLKTVGAPAAIRLKADRNKIKADRSDLSYVNVEIIDAEGNLVPNAEDIEVNFTITGNGELAGVGNGNPVDATSFQQPKKKVWHGKGLAIIRPKGSAGKIIIKANAKGLKEGSIEIITQ